MLLKPDYIRLCIIFIFIHSFLVSWFSPLLSNGLQGATQPLMVTRKGFQTVAYSSLFDYMYITTSFQHRYEWMTHCSINGFWTNNHTDDRLTRAYQHINRPLMSDVCIVNDVEKFAWISPFPMLAISQPCDYNLNMTEKVPKRRFSVCTVAVRSLQSNF